MIFLWQKKTRQEKPVLVADPPRASSKTHSNIYLLSDIYVIPCQPCHSGCIHTPLQILSDIVDTMSTSYIWLYRKIKEGCDLIQ